MSGLSARARGLLAVAATAYEGRPALDRLLAVASHLDEPLRVAITGRVKAGKSTLLNALVGRQIAATDAGECTQVVTWYANADTTSAWAYPRTGQPQELVLLEGAHQTVLDLGGLRADDLDRVRVDLPSARLERMTLIDTPGMGSLSERIAARTREVLTGDAATTGEVDAVLYLLRHLHTSDVDFLEILHEAQSGRTTPVNAVGVLSRADEVGGGGVDAVDQAAKVAYDYRQDARVRGMLHTVVPVAGLLAEAAATLRAEEFADLTGLAAAGEAVTAPMLLSRGRGCCAGWGCTACGCASTRSATASPTTRA
jgi:hypothetical protein